MRLALLLLLALGAAARAQDVPVDTLANGDPVDLPPNTEPFEVGVFRTIYGIESPAFVVPMRLVNQTSYLVFLGATPAMWAGHALAGADLDPALRMTATQAVNAGLTIALKRGINRPRPYAVLRNVRARDRRHQDDEVFDPYSFPSGHTSSAFAIATSLSLSYPEWYVIAPSAAWATAMGLTRIWHGVHYPTDVLVGAAIGTASGVAVHLLLPRVFGEERDEAAVVPLQIVIPL